MVRRTQSCTRTTYAFKHTASYLWYPRRVFTKSPSLEDKTVLASRLRNQARQEHVLYVVEQAIRVSVMLTVPLSCSLVFLSRLGIQGMYLQLARTSSGRYEITDYSQHSSALQELSRFRMLRPPVPVPVD